MTKQEKQRTANYSYIQRRKAEGWRSICLTLPPDIYDKVVGLKRELMTQYKQSKKTI